MAFCATEASHDGTMSRHQAQQPTLISALASAEDRRIAQPAPVACKHKQPFLDLPAEVRNAIYEAVARSYTGVWIFQPDTPLARDTAGPLCLLATCRRVCDEFYDLLLWNTRLRLSPKLHDIPSKLTHRTQHIRNLELLWSRHDHWKCLIVVSKWSSITRLRVVMGENISVCMALDKLQMLFASAFPTLEHVDVSNPWPRLRRHRR